MTSEIKLSELRRKVNVYTERFQSLYKEFKSRRNQFHLSKKLGTDVIFQSNNLFLQVLDLIHTMAFFSHDEISLELVKNTLQIDGGFAQ